MSRPMDLYLDRMVSKTLRDIRIYKELPLYEALSKAYDIPYYPLNEMTDTERMFCPGINCLPAVCITTVESTKIFYKRDLLTASLPIVHEIGHILLDLPDDPDSENTVNLIHGNAGLTIPRTKETLYQNRNIYFFLDLVWDCSGLAMYRTV